MLRRGGGSAILVAVTVEREERRGRADNDDEVGKSI